MLHFVRQAFTDADLQRIGLAIIWGASLALMFVIVYVAVMVPVFAYRVAKRSGVLPWPIPGAHEGSVPKPAPWPRAPFPTNWHIQIKRIDENWWRAIHPITGEESIGRNAWEAMGVWFREHGRTAHIRNEARRHLARARGEPMVWVEPV